VRGNGGVYGDGIAPTAFEPHNAGRWPANVIHDGSDEVLEAFEAFGVREARGGGAKLRSGKHGGIYGAYEGGQDKTVRNDTGSAARFFGSFGHTEEEMLIWRAKAIMAEWNSELASTADNSSRLSREAAYSALDDAVTWASRGGRRLSECPALSTTVTPSELRRVSESVITAILSFESGFSPEWQHSRRIENGCLVKCAEAQPQTGTITITISHWKSDGSAAPVTFNTTLTSLGHGARGLSGASRFHYCAKASRAERNQSKHPTQKPLALMKYLCKLITPPGGTVLDMFAGSGTTLLAAQLEGFDAVGIEQDAAYVADARRRLGITFQLEAAD
jgi:hypothetical protein